MLEPEEIFAALVALGAAQGSRGQARAVTAGPTFEAIDPVRGITNSSSGKMGYALAQAAAEAGAEVTLGERADGAADARGRRRASTSQRRGDGRPR